MATKLYRNLQLFSIQKQYTAAIDAPSVSVCIPARNEMHAMTQCLERVLASDYRKLEVIVYDDGSTDKTQHIIRSFAQDGVRFIGGDTPPAGWLGKNYALDCLAREASGTYVIFLDVDTAIDVTTISQLVGYILTEQADMVSVLPGRRDTHRASALLGYLRYFWEIILASKTRMASSSAVWMVRRTLLIDRYNGFVTTALQVMPEAWLAQQFAQTNAYRCLVTNTRLGAMGEKKWPSQRETGRRVLYPMAGHTPVRAVLALAGLLVLNLPLAVLATGILAQDLLTAGMAVALYALCASLYGLFLQRTWQSRWLVGTLLWPIIILQELYFFIYSLVGYARGSITWKGRTVITSRS